MSEVLAQLEKKGGGLIDISSKNLFCTFGELGTSNGGRMSWDNGVHTKGATSTSFCSWNSSLGVLTITKTSDYLIIRVNDHRHDMTKEHILANATVSDILPTVVREYYAVVIVDLNS